MSESDSLPVVPNLGHCRGEFVDGDSEDFDVLVTFIQQALSLIKKREDSGVSLEWYRAQIVDERGMNLCEHRARCLRSGVLDGMLELIQSEWREMQGLPRDSSVSLVRSDA
jgi:hypothetical protein